jgi:hypothetical protein
MISRGISTLENIFSSNQVTLNNLEQASKQRFYQLKVKIELNRICLMLTFNDLFATVLTSMLAIVSGDKVTVE